MTGLGKPGTVQTVLREAAVHFSHRAPTRGKLGEQRLEFQQCSVVAVFDALGVQGLALLTDAVDPYDLVGDSSGSVLHLDADFLDVQGEPLGYGVFDGVFLVRGIVAYWFHAAVEGGKLEFFFKRGHIISRLCVSW